MKFRNRKELDIYIRRYCTMLGFGSAGSAYYDKKTRSVIKIFDYALDDDYADAFIFKDVDFLRFADIKNGTYVFPYENIIMDDRVVGYMTEVAHGKNISMIDPLTVKLDSIEKSFVKTFDDVRTISESGVLSEDVPYNVLFSEDEEKTYIIDSDYYTKDEYEPDYLYDRNLSKITYSYKLFLVDGYFNNFINKSKKLKSSYEDRDCELLEFLKEFRKELSESVGYGVETLEDVKELVGSNKRKIFIRTLK